MAVLLSACGGGGGNANSGLTTNNPASISAPTDSTNNTVTSKAAILQQLATDNPLPSSQDASTSPNARQLFDTLPQTTAPIPAATFSMNNIPTAAANTDTSPVLRATALEAITGGSSATIAPPVAGCASINVGYLYNATTVSAGSLQCFQFVVGAGTNNSASKIDSQVLLPSGVSGQAYLFCVDPTTGQLTTTLDSDASPRNPLLVQAIAQNARMALVIAPSSGTGGKTFQFLVANRLGYDSYEANDKPNNATQVAMNTTVNANIDVAGIDQDYYFYPLNTGQTSAQVKVTFTPNQTASVRLAQKMGANNYSLYADSTITSNYSGATLLFNGLPANTAGTNTPYGLLVRVSGASSAAAAKEAYSLRVGVGNVVIKSYSVTNLENLTGYYPKSELGDAEFTSPSSSNIIKLSYAGALSAYSYADVYIQVADTAGNPVPGENIILATTADTWNPANTKTYIILTTDSAGNASYRFNLGGCGNNSLTRQYSAWNALAKKSYNWVGTADRAAVAFNLVTAPTQYGIRLIAAICSEQMI